MRTQAVSYTHLDVYKRQPRGGGNVKGEDIKKIAQTDSIDSYVKRINSVCLLYTSYTPCITVIFSYVTTFFCCVATPIISDNTRLD